MIFLYKYNSRMKKTHKNKAKGGGLIEDIEKLFKGKNEKYIEAMPEILNRLRDLEEQERKKQIERKRREDERKREEEEKRKEEEKRREDERRMEEIRKKKQYHIN